MASPRIVDDPAYRDLRADDFQHFAEHIAGRKQVDFSNADLRGVDLRNVDVSKLILRDAYLRDADLRGLDLRNVDLEGCSLHGAQISGTYFPANLSPQEIANSVKLGTRMRTNADRATTLW
jgi:uncharacterized protein YjbI with pentapeptide repeats